MGRSRYKIINPTKPHFITCTITHWIPIFTRKESVDIIYESLKYLQTSDNLKIHAYVILENHLHLIISSDNLPKTIQKFKSFTAKEILSLLKINKVYTILEQLAFYKKAHRKETNYQLWQEGRGVHVVSGLAMGVDTLAHVGAYPKTIGVLGNSLDIIYPKVNKDLISNMQQNSLILSEYEANTKATPWSFVDRNRIVVALSKAVVIAQADEKSGSMHSAKFAQKLGKPLYVLPQRLDESRGTNKLLGEGKAKLIHDIDKFCDTFGKVQEEKDEIIEFCKQNPLLEDALKKYGDRIYEYELDGRLDISGVYIRILG